jgi:phage shock protein A
MKIFKRLFKIGQAEAHAAVNKLEDPINLTEQGIRDMKEDLDKALNSLAQVKAMAIRARKDVADYQDKAKQYEEKAVLLLKRAQTGDIDSLEADRLATEALNQKENNLKHTAQALGEQKKYEESVEKLESNINRLKSTINKWENELKTLKARVKVSNATKNINKQMAQIDSTDTISMLERMKDQVAQDEALAESYEEMANETRSIDEEIDKTLAESSKSDKARELEALKEKLGIKKDNTSDQS